MYYTTRSQTTMLGRLLSFALLMFTPVTGENITLEYQRYWAVTPSSDIKVPVQLGVMSRCPDALLCENVFDRVLEKVSERVDLSLIYIAKINASEPYFGVQCLHGPQECAGNVQQLCVAEYEPAIKWWQFIQCQNFQGRTMIGDPGTAMKCAKASGFDWESSDVGHCAGKDGSGRSIEGINLLKQSIAMAEHLHVEKSCTVLINGRKVCIHDGTWKQCEDGHTVNDFVRQINDEYERLNKKL
ncbi:hypothetical protein BDZ94DRAFT_1260902 [Collybia nuda]|uniref:Uncharacterized protein n=1 Tax=Collybia nuda TaxID=64659 RepID=A0A9P6CJA8_9AGAR|nr:hypothetical protein BDZ94DRAFT_1260902 [Collybia nuda]